MMTSVSGDDRTYIHYSYKSILYHPIERIRGCGVAVGNYPFIVHQTSPTVQSG